MTIALKKFGTTLISRQAGKEALSAYRPTLNDVKPDEVIKVDFTDVIAFTPSWGDEFLTPLAEEFGDRFILMSTDNPSVLATLKIIESSTGIKFQTDS